MKGNHLRALNGIASVATAFGVLAIIRLPVDRRVFFLGWIAVAYGAYNGLDIILSLTWLRNEVMDERSKEMKRRANGIGYIVLSVEIAIVIMFAFISTSMTSIQLSFILMASWLLSRAGVEFSYLRFIRPEVHPKRRFGSALDRIRQ